MVMYKIEILKKALKDRDKVKNLPALKKNVDRILAILGENPFQSPPPFEILSGDLKGLFSRRINRQHRLVYQVREQDKSVVIMSMWTHYE